MQFIYGYFVSGGGVISAASCSELFLVVGSSVAYLFQKLIFHYN